MTGALALTLPTVAYAETGADRFDDAPKKSVLDSKYRPAALSADAKVTVMVELSGDPVAVAQATSTTGLSSARAAEIRSGLKRSQDKVKTEIQHRGGKVLSQMQSAYNGMRVTLPRRQINAVAALPGVKSVTAARTYRLTNAVSVPFLGIPQVWQKSKYDGKGVKVAIIDSGIDYTHAGFGGPGTVEAYEAAQQNESKPADPAWFGPKAPRVKGGYDFVGDDYNASDDAHSTPHPDANPLDCGGHGSHVAGTAAGGGVNADGTAYTGPYDASAQQPTHAFRIGPGVAPRADLYALKVFGCEGSTDVVTEAIDWAVKHHMDVINMSLGADFGTAGDPDSIAAQNAQAAGVVVVASSGNAGANPYLTGSPAAGRGVISVSAIDATAKTFPAATLSFDGTTMTAINANDAELPSGGMTIVNLVDKQGTEADESLGCTPADYTANGIAKGSNQIAVVQRNDCARVRKAAAGQQAGAAAVIMVNTSDDYPPYEGPITTIPEDPTLDPPLPAEDYTVTIPFLGVRSTDKAALTAAGGKTLTLAGHAPLPNNDYRAYTSFSSAGPRTGDSAVRPGVAAPGLNITSVGVGTGNEANVLSGTSMAAPHVTGVAALARQAHKSWKARDIAAALVSTADPSQVAGYGVVLGGGLVDAKQVVGTKIYAYGDRYSSRAGTVHDASLSFGFSEPSGSYTSTKKLTLVNKSSKKVTFRLYNEKSAQSRKASVSFSPKKVTVSAKKSRTVKVTLRAKASDLGNALSSTDQFSFREVSGNVKVTSSGGNGTLRVPYLLVPRARATVAASQKVVKVNAAANTTGKPGTKANASAKPNAPTALTGRALDVTLTNRKGALTTAADFYTWGQSDKQDLSSKAPGGVDLRASGVQSFPNGDDQLLVFAVNSWTRWSNAATTEFDVEIDTNRDGEADYLLFSDDLGVLDHTIEFDGVSRIFLYDIAKDTLYDTGREAVAPTDSSTILLPIDASALGLDGSSDPFAYAVSSYSIIDDAYSDEMQGWADYDLANPAIANGDYVSVKVNGKVTVRLAVDRDAVERLKPKGTMVVVLDNKSGKEEALLLPTPTF